MSELTRPLHFQLPALVVAALMLIPVVSRATHIVGGEMTYTCLGNNLYKIDLTIFRDCYNGVPWFDNPASIGIFTSSNNQLFSQQLVPLNFNLNDTLNPDLGSECFVVPPNVCVHTTSYTTTVSLPFAPGGYHIVYQRCCRNNTISNIIDPEDTGATYSIEIGESALQECNSSPVFNNWPPLYICVNQSFQIDQSAVDPDGDSLVYRLCNPIQGADDLMPMPQPPNPPPYFPVQWIDPPYSINNMLNGFPGGVPMTIHPQTGILSGTPNTIGQFVIGICVDEYRDGLLIGSKRRDYQVNVGECGIAVASFFAPEKVCDSFEVSFSNQSTGAGIYLWQFNDPANPGAGSTEFNPSYTYSDTGLYTITLIADPGTNCADTFSTQVHILPNSLYANFELQTLDCEDAMTIQITDSSLDTASSIVQWSWQLSYGDTALISSDQDPLFIISQPGSAALTLTVTAANGCVETITQNFPIIFLDQPLAADSVGVCAGGNPVSLNPGGGLPGASYSWSPPDFLDDPNSPNPTANPDTTITYTVLINNPAGNCKVESDVTVIVSPQVEVIPLVDTILNGQSVEIFATYDEDYQYSWSPPLYLDDSGIHDPVSTPTEPVLYTLTVTDENGCIATRQVNIVVLTLCEEPYVFMPSGFSPNGDGRNDRFRVMGNNLEEVYLAVYDRWGTMVFETREVSGAWDGTFKGRKLPPDVYGFYARVRCIGGLDYEKQGNITLLE
jgi:gliding motility-associated-like protein